MSNWLERLWDSVADHLRKHPRKYAALSFVVIFLPRWIPSVQPIWRLALAQIPESMTMPFSWDWITVPLGLGLLALVFWQTRARPVAEDGGIRTSGLVVHWARYGIGDQEGQYVDVTGVVQAEIRGSRLSMPATNEALRVGNPFKGKKKRLVVKYSLVETVTTREREYLSIPDRQS